MSVRSILTSRIGYAVLLAVALVVGTLLGGAAFQSANPEFDRIVWLEHDAGEDSGGAAVRRVLFADGRFLALSSDGYRAGVVAAASTSEIFATVRAAARSWAPSYGANGLVGERIELSIEGPGPVHVTIANPGMNFGLPSELGRVLRLLAAADTTIAHVAFAPSSLRFTAIAVTSGDAPLEAMPDGFPLTAASQAGGVVVGGEDLSVLRSVWTDLDARLDPANAHRYVDVDGQAWRIMWMLDVDAIGPLAASAMTP